MSIKTTKAISRNYAINRIKEVATIAQGGNYKLLESYSFEPEENIQTFIDEFSLDVSNINYWTNDMLESIMDRPFFRKSMFDNYSVE